MGCSQSTAGRQEEEANKKLKKLQTLLADDTDMVDGGALLQAMPEGDPKLAKWIKMGGDQLEEPLREGWVKLVRASWLVELSESGGKLCRRQELPRKAFVSLDELKAAGPFEEPHLGWTWLRIIVVSYPWLQPGHPDPHGENLRVIAKALKAFGNEGGPYGVLIDFASLYQVERTAEEYAVFQLALGSLHLFYSHENTVVFKVTKFPPGYPNNPSFRYVLPDGANTVEYMKRGWCATESAVSGLVKPSDKVLDLGELEDGVPLGLFFIVNRCRAGRAPPLHPEDFDAALGEKTFTNKKDDFDKVASLYSVAFHRLLGSAQKLDFQRLDWGPNEVRQFLKALRSNSTLQDLSLQKNKMGPEGAVAMAEALHIHNSLQTLDLAGNDVGQEGVAALAKALRENRSLKKLDMRYTNIGNEGRAVLREACSRKVGFELVFD